MDAKKQFIDDEARAKELVQSSLARAYSIYWSGVELILEVVSLLTGEEEAVGNDSKPDNQYSKAYLVLIGRSIQHAESIRILVEHGLYGDCFPIMRNILSNLNMMQYLHNHPELLDLFLSETQEDYQSNKEFRNTFSESAVEGDLVKRGWRPISAAFQMLSKTSHASYFGAQLYWTEDYKSGKHHLKYGPRYEPKKALLLTDFFSGVHSDHLDMIIRHKRDLKESLNDRKWHEVRREADRLSREVRNLWHSTQIALNLLWPNQRTGS